MANALTAVRLLLAYPFARLMARDDAPEAFFAALVFVAAIATDLVDGPVARRRGTASAWGGAFDHTADFIFVTGGLAAGAARSVFPWILPLLVTAAFSQYMVDSYWLHGESKLRGSRLGRYNGILYFVPLGGDILIRLGLGFVRPLLLPIVWMLIASTLVSMGQRLAVSGRFLKKVPGRPPKEQQTDRRVEEDKKIVLDEPESGHLSRPLGKEHDPEKNRH